MWAITAVTVQNSLWVSGFYELSPYPVADRIEAVATDTGVGTAKTGMLASALIIVVVAEVVSRLGIPSFVVEPVTALQHGDPLLRPEALSRSTFCDHPAGHEHSRAGSGDVLAASITVGLARGTSLKEAVRQVKVFTSAAVNGSFPLGAAPAGRVTAFASATLAVGSAAIGHAGRDRGEHDQLAGHRPWPPPGQPFPQARTSDGGSSRPACRALFEPRAAGAAAS